MYSLCFVLLGTSTSGDRFTIDLRHHALSAPGVRPYTLTLNHIQFLDLFELDGLE